MGIHDENKNKQAGIRRYLALGPEHLEVGHIVLGRAHMLLDVVLEVANTAKESPDSVLVQHTLEASEKRLGLGYK